MPIQSIRLAVACLTLTVAACVTPQNGMTPGTGQQRAQQQTSSPNVPAPAPVATALPMQGRWLDSNGDWIYVTHTGGAVTATPRSERITPHWTEARGQASGGSVALEHYKGTRMADRQTGTVSSNGSEIRWANGSTWRFHGSEDQLRTGRWVDSQGATIDVTLRGNDVVALPQSAKTQEYWNRGVGALEGSSLRMEHRKGDRVTDTQTGSVSNGGKRITWSNGTHWSWQS